jgi:hypothetical protein
VYLIPEFILVRKINNFGDVQIVLNELLNWRDRLESKAKDQRGLQIKNAGDATDPQDLVTLRQLGQSLQTSASDLDVGSGSGSIGRVPFSAQFRIFNSTIQDNAAPNPMVFGITAGRASRIYRVSGIPRVLLQTQIEVKFRVKYSPPSNEEFDIGTFVIPASSTPATAIIFSNSLLEHTTLPDKSVLLADILDSDESVDFFGIAIFMLEWEPI